MKIFTLMMIVVMVSGCDFARGTNSQNAAKVKGTKVLPTDEEMKRGVSASYRSPPGMLQECLGRLIFDVSKPVVWPTYASRDSDRWLYSFFSQEVFDPGDGIRLGDVKIGVLSPITDATLEEIRFVMPEPKIVRLKKNIADAMKYTEKVKNSKMPEARIQRVVEDRQNRIREWEKMITETQAGYETLSLPFAEGEGFWTSEARDRDGSYTLSILQAYLRRDGFLYVFQSKVALDSEMTKARHHERFIEVMQRFRPRKTHEIPTELGVCIPHGFISDDGRTITDIKQSMRFEDAPGVLYTIRTGNSTEGNEKAAFITAIGTAMAGKVDSRGESGPRPVLTHQIAPHLTKIGELNASQGGFAIRISNVGKSPYEVYNVFTGYSGWRDVAVLPFILIEMSTRTIEQAPELRQNPPPFKQSMDRLNTLLKSTRLRPTNPLMPELAGLTPTK